MKTYRIKVNRIFVVLLSIILIFTLFPLSINAENSIEHDGYIVVLSKEIEDNIDENNINEIVKDEIYQADELSDIRTEISADCIEYIEPNYVLNLCDVYTPSDLRYQESRWAQDIMNIQIAWNRGYFGNYINSSDAATVAIIDSGLIGTGSSASTKHEDLDYSRITSGINTINDTYNTSDDNGHGTFIAGIISAKHNNLGIAGNMPKLNLKTYKAVNWKGESTIAWEVAAIYAAIEDQVDVINISLESSNPSSVEQDAINEAIEKGIIVCASAGNGGGSRLKYPASNENTISVGSINRFLGKSIFSQQNDMVDCVAPGESILSLNHLFSNDYRIDSGTSFSAPQVAALAGMCKSIDSSIDHDRFMELLKSTSRDAGTSGYDTSYGWGIVDYGNMLDALVPEDNSIWSAEITGISSNADYIGNEITFENLKITMPDGTELSANSDYTVTYFNNINSNMGMVTLQGIGEYTGRINKYFAINGVPSSSDRGGNSGGGESSSGHSPAPIGGTDPETEPKVENESEPIVEAEPIKVAKPIVKSLKAGKKSFAITWKKQTVDGYQLQYSTTKIFKNGTRKTVTINKKKTSYNVKKLKARKKYYVRMRCCKNVNGKSVYSIWSGFKTIKTK